MTVGIIRNTGNITLGDVNYSWRLLRNLAEPEDDVEKGDAAGQ